MQACPAAAPHVGKRQDDRVDLVASSSSHVFQGRSGRSVYPRVLSLIQQSAQQRACVVACFPSLVRATCAPGEIARRCARAGCPRARARVEDRDARPSRHVPGSVTDSMDGGTRECRIGRWNRERPAVHRRVRGRGRRSRVRTAAALLGVARSPALRMQHTGLDDRRKRVRRSVAPLAVRTTILCAVCGAEAASLTTVPPPDLSCLTRPVSRSAAIAPATLPGDGETRGELAPGAAGPRCRRPA